MSLSGSLQDRVRDQLQGGCKLLAKLRALQRVSEIHLGNLHVLRGQRLGPRAFAFFHRLHETVVLLVRHEEPVAAYFREEKLIAVDSINRPQDHMLARKLLTGGVQPTVAQVGDPAFDLKSLATPAANQLAQEVA